MSDHSPILMNTDAGNSPHSRYFVWFENKWFLELALKDVVETSWTLDDNFSLLGRLRSCSESLVSWGK